MAKSTWAQYSSGFTDADTALVDRMREIVDPLDGVTENVTVTQVTWKRTRIFTSGYIKSHNVEVAIDLLRTENHPLLKAAFPTSKQIITHRFTIHSLEEFDDSIAALVVEAWETVGPGFR